MNITNDDWRNSIHAPCAQSNELACVKTEEWFAAQSSDAEFQCTQADGLDGAFAVAFKALRKLTKNKLVASGRKAVIGRVVVAVCDVATQAHQLASQLVGHDVLLRPHAVAKTRKRRLFQCALFPVRPLAFFIPLEFPAGKPVTCAENVVL